MEARNRSLADWFARIRSGQLRLPRFQRHEAWGFTEVGDLLEAVLRGLPSGAVLILEVGDQEQFVSRPMAGAPEPIEKGTEHLLDGQQRLTALWRALHADYDDRSFFVTFEADVEHGDARRPVVVPQRRWTRNDSRRPAWADKPAELHKREYLPLELCRPGEGVDVRAWCEEATAGDKDKAWDLSNSINDLRAGIASYNVPFLSLPSSTPKDVALDVFIKLNTSSVKLSPFDIVVAQFEDETDESLHELVEEVHSSVPGLSRYRDPEDVVLDVAALRENRVAGQVSYFKLDLSTVKANWQQLIDGLAWAVELLEEENVFDRDRLPTIAVLPVLAAIHPDLAKALDEHGNARTLLKRYLWRSFLTSRYESSAGSNALQDYRGLKATLAGGEERAPIFDDREYPLPDEEALRRARWPKTKDILARGVLALSLRAGGVDLADGIPVNVGNVEKREYHHLFPDSLLQKIGRMSKQESYRALNCALVSWNTNRNIAAKSPLQYLRERVERSDLGVDEVAQRLASHLIPYKELAQAGGADATDAVSVSQLYEAYEAFLTARASMVSAEARKRCGAPATNES